MAMTVKEIMARDPLTLPDDVIAQAAEIMRDEEHGGDLRKLRDAADRDPEQERRLLKRFKGIGDVGVDIFREVQGAWDELHPFLDKRALRNAAAYSPRTPDPVVCRPNRP